MQITIAIDC